MTRNGGTQNADAKKKYSLIYEQKKKTVKLETLGEKKAYIFSRQLT